MTRFGMHAVTLDSRGPTGSRRRAGIKAPWLPGNGWTPDPVKVKDRDMAALLVRY